MESLITLAKLIATPLYNPYVDTATKLKSMNEHIALVSATCGYVPLPDGVPDYVTAVVEDAKAKLTITDMTKFGMQMLSQTIYTKAKKKNTDEEKLEVCRNTLINFINKITEIPAEDIIDDLIKCNEHINKGSSAEHD